MRCPNCGNENPEDYVFCDECGARLQPLADTGQGDSAPSGMAATDAAGSTGMSGAAAADGGGDMAAWQPSDDSGMSAGAGEDSGVGWQPQASQDTDAAGSAAGGM